MMRQMLRACSRRIGWGLAFAALAGAPAWATTAKVDAKLAGAVTCAELGKTDFSGIAGSPASISKTEVVAASAGMAEYCRVTGVIQPQIGFEIRLPTKTWNGRYFQTGCGFFCGVVRLEGCADAQARDFVVVAQNMGHVGAGSDDGLWGSVPALREDFGRRSTHVTAVVGKAITEAYYGQRPAFAYFRGCSTGGREGLSEAQFFPEDFDGIIAGDPAFPGRQGGLANVWDTRQLVRRDGSDVFTPEKLKLLNAAVLAKCDGLDGLKDGIIVDPRACQFDVRKLQCASADRADCLNAEQVKAALALYDGPRNSQGVRLVPGHRLFGSELAWESATRAPVADGYLRYLAFETNPPASYRVWDFDFDKDVVKLEKMAALYDPVAPYGEPDLSAYKASGGKLILYHGFADPTVSALNTLDYYARAADRAGGMESLKSFARLYLIPGMFHCRGGDAPNTFDMLEQMVRWVEKGEPPERIVLTQLSADGKPARTRPSFPYPAVPRYIGHGDVNDEANFISVSPKAVSNDRMDWNWAPSRSRN